ncbi:ABC transporter permease [Mycoplasmopsis lipofaciens]|uniref:ABC transporter permease n=1 Tax=Mycoplasmopsis lipofaciens TaxID=114884 RepID=UPI00047F3BC7|nr:ABC transporter permease subunit [Mycoplasmopsis lipofaciens]
MNLKIKQKLALNKRLALFIPYVIIAIFLIILPLLLILINAFIPRKDFDSFSLVKERGTWVIISRSLRLGIFSSIFCLLLGFPFAYFVAMSKSKILPVYAMSLVLSPMIIFTIAKIYAIRGFFLSFVPEDNLNAEWFMILAITYLNLPYIIMPLYTVFRDMPRNIIEASSDLGYNKFQTLFKIVIPYSFKAIVSGFSLIFLAGATTFVISSKLLPNGGILQTIGAVINDYSNPSNQYDLALGSTLVLVVSAVFISCYAVINFAPRIIVKLRKKGK